jgi:hypothetical protein
MSKPIAEVCYEAYNASDAWKNPGGTPNMVPTPWKDLPENVKHAWTDAVNAAVTAVEARLATPVAEPPPTLPTHPKGKHK